MRLAILLLVGVLATPLLGCVSIKAGNGPGASLVRMDGPVNAHIAAGPPVRAGSLVNVGVLRNTARPGEVVSVDVWPLFGVGVGVLGARASVLGLEVGVGSLFYDPQPPPPEAAPEEKDAPAAAPEPAEPADGAPEDEDAAEGDDPAAP